MSAKRDVAAFCLAAAADARAQLAIDAPYLDACAARCAHAFRHCRWERDAGPYSQRKVALARISEGAEGWIALTDGVVGNGRALYQAVVDADLEGIVGKRLADAYHPKLARWHKILDRGHSQPRGRAEWLRARWVNYMFPKPGQTEPSEKWAYVKKVTLDGAPSLIASGFYVK